MPTSTTGKEQNADFDIRSELDSLKSQLSDLLDSAQEEGSSKASRLQKKVGRQVEHYKEAATDKAEEAMEAGMDGLYQVQRQMRKNPVLALSIAFGAGYLVSRLMASRES
jgi:ElaB/YqjD/DUF883 family membrane-anchored ribosome-binding protein